MSAHRTGCIGGLAALALVAAPAVARADVPALAQAENPELIEGNGYRLNDHAVAHPFLGAEFGVINNLFYEDTNPVTSAVIRLTARVDIATDKLDPIDPLPGEETSAEEQELTPRQFEYRAGLKAAYEEYPSGNDAARAQRNVTFDGTGHLVVYPEGRWRFNADDRLTRDVRPRNFEDTSSTSRDDNYLRLGLTLQPGARVFMGTLRYENQLELFEGDSSFADRMNHTFALSGDWQWRPFTKFTAEASVGFFGPLGDSTLRGMPYKQSSLPIRGTIGAASAITETTEAKLHFGWAYGSYSAGEGFNAPVFGAEFGYQPGPATRYVVSYDHDYVDSVNANYYSDHAIDGRMYRQIGTFLVDGGGSVRIREYAGIPMALGAPNRFDTVFALRARAQFVVWDKYVMSAEYIMSIVATDYTQTVVNPDGVVVGLDDPSYLRNDLMLGLRAAF